MKKTFQLSVAKVDNGFIIRSQSDVPAENGQKIASTEDEAAKIATELVTSALQILPPPAPPKP